MKLKLWDLRSSGILRSVEWWFCADVSVQPIFPIFKSQEVFFFLTLEEGNDKTFWLLKMGTIGCPETSV
jgi:hypothetical protein